MLWPGKARSEAAAFLVLLAAAGCAASRAPQPQAAPPLQSGPEPTSTESAQPEEVNSPDPSPQAPSSPQAQQNPSSEESSSRPRLSALCRQDGEEPEAVALDTFRRRLEETVCSANLWLDGLFGGEANVESARSISGRLEASFLHAQAYGDELKLRLRVSYDLPNLKHRMRLFLGRQELEEATQDRAMPLGTRSAFFDLGEREEWLAGFGYTPPGRYGRRFSFRVGVRPQSETIVYAQARYRQNVFLSEFATLRFRETLFWRNREHGFGATTAIDLDRLLNRYTILRWGNVGTISQATEGLEWRSSLLLYHNLHHGRAISGELFLRGATQAEVSLKEYGLRSIYRQSLLRKWLFGELLVGYSFPRLEREQTRRGSVIFGFGIDVLFGPEPF